MAPRAGGVDRLCHQPYFGGMADSTDPGNPNLEELSSRAIAGDERALNDLLAATQPLAMKHCQRLLPNRQDAEEATQDALLAIARNINGFAGRSKFTTWIYPICTNASIDRYRKLKRRRSVVGHKPVEHAAPGSTPSVVAGARIDMLEAAEKLDRDVVELVLMRDLLDLDYREIAELRDTKEATVRWQVAEGRKKFRPLLSPLNK